MFGADASLIDILLVVFLLGLLSAAAVLRYWLRRYLLRKHTR
jgi:hypothetical protein